MRHVAPTSHAVHIHILKRHLSSLNAVIWGIALCCHAACTNFAGLFAVRFILGMCEGSTTAGFMIVSSMFYTRREHTARVGYWSKDHGQLLSEICLTINSSNKRNWSKIYVISPSRPLIQVAAQIIAGVISFGSLHIHTPGFESWQWYGRIQHPTNITFTLCFT
jgi:MFS family permease